MAWARGAFELRCWWDFHPMFVLYVEGPRDRDVLRAWSQRLNPIWGRALSRTAVILGGRQPERASVHFRRVRESQPAARALCVLDRDGGADAPPEEEPGLEFHVWGRRHIESYLLVPDAIRRSLRLPAQDTRLDRAFRGMLPPADDENAFQKLDAKRLLAPEGELARAVGRRVDAGRIARAMRPDELHPEVLSLLERALAATRGA